MSDGILGDAQRQAIREVATAIISRETVKGATLDHARHIATYDILLVMGLSGDLTRQPEPRHRRMAVRTLIASLGA